jgi:aminomethyltransferase
MENQNKLEKKTPLYEAHVKLGAKMVNFAGWMMPVQYESILKEHESVRTTSGVFDISHMGEFILEGPDSFALLQELMTNDLKLLEISKGQYSCMCYENGTVVDDMVYYMEDKDRFRMIVNASNIEKDFKWIDEHASNYNANLNDISLERCRLAIQGQKTEEFLGSIVDIELSKIKRFYFSQCQICNIPVFLARTGYTGEVGFEISFSQQHVKLIWNAILETGVKPIGLGARDSLRLEACYSLYGHEISDNISPVEAGIGWVVKQKEGVDFIGKEVLLRQKEEGTDRTLVGLNLIDRGIIRENYKIFKNQKQVGHVTSGGYSPTLKKTIGLGLVKTEYKTIGTELDIEIRGKMLKAIVVSIPFYQNI